MVGIGLIVFARRDRDNPIPFGPYLAAAGMIALFYGTPLTRFAQGLVLPGRRLAGSWTLYSSARFAVGLTGGIGCGKTTVADLFAARGAAVIDTDQIAHGLTAPHGAAMPALIAEFGPDYAHAGRRPRPREDAHPRVCRPGARARLEAILHPRIRDATAAAALLAGGPYTIFVVPLLIESGTGANAWRACSRSTARKPRRSRA